MNQIGSKLRNIFRDEGVFDSEYLPEVIHFRDAQLYTLTGNLQPAANGISPVNSLLVCPPSTGKTCVLARVLSNLAGMVDIAHIRCPVATTSYRVMVRIFESVCGHQAPQTGYPMIKLYDAVCERLLESGKVLIVALDDAGVLDTQTAGEIFRTLLKAGEEYAVKIGVVAVSTERIGLDSAISAVFQPTEIHFPLYSRNEIRFILAERMRMGFNDGAFSMDAFEKAVNYTFRLSDLRFGISLMKRAGLEAAIRDSSRVEVGDVERACSSGRTEYLLKNLLALTEKERLVLRQIYLSERTPTTGEVFESLQSDMGYTSYFVILEKLERLRFVDLVFARKGRGNTRLIYRKYGRREMLKVFERVGV
jgi:cell division control protein 6